MFLSRLEGMLGKAPGEYRAIPAVKKRRVRPRTLPYDSQNESFFATSSFADDLSDQARKREVARLFSRMRSELMEIAQEFAAEEESVATAQFPIRQGVFIEMMIASEFVSEELDSVIAELCVKGLEAEKAENSEMLEQICQMAARFALLRSRISEFQHELDSMVEMTVRIFHKYEFSCSLNFDPMIREQMDSKTYISQFIESVNEAVLNLTEVACNALKQRDFETASQLCACNVQLDNFLGDAKRTIAEIVSV